MKIFDLPVKPQSKMFEIGLLTSKRWSKLLASFAAVAPMLVASDCLPGIAKTPYSLNGIPAKQVQPVKEVSILEAELTALQQKLRARARPTSLSEAIEVGLLSSPQLAIAYAQIQGQQWNLIAVQRQWLPTLNASSIQGIPGQNWSSGNSFIGEPVNINQFAYESEQAVNIGINLAWTFFDPSRGPSIKAASEDLKRQKLLFDVSARNLVLQIQDSYFSLQEQIQLIRSYQEILSGTTKQVQLTEAQFNSGLVSIADVEQIRTQQYSTLATLLATYRQLITSSAAVAEVMALPPGTLVVPKEPLSSVGQWQESLQSTIDQALKLREEIQASLATASSASWTATSLFNSYWPKFNISAGANYQSNNSSGSFVGVNGSVNQSNLNWNGGVGVGFTWQIFDGGIAAAQGEAQRAAQRQAMDQAAERKLIVTREVEQAYASYITSKLALEATRLQAESARLAALAVKERFSVGVTDMATVVVSLSQAITAANNYATAIRSYNTSVAGLYRSSAKWPEATLSLVEQRVQQLRKR
jgi:outer membrane protein TolC